MAQAAAVPPPVSTRRYTFRPKIKVHTYGEKVLLWDPPTGSWCFLDGKVLPVVEGLRSLCEEGRWEEIPDNALPILETLHQRGLVARDERWVWSPRWFAHHENKVNTIILKVIGACNLGCTYCYDFNQVRFGKTMEIETARRAIDGVWERSADRLNVLFHGGEPMMARSLIFELVPEIHRKAQQAGKDVGFSMQTNGTLIDADWFQLFRDFDFSVGVSLDGPAELNDRFRINHSGRGTYEKIVELLVRHDMLRRVGVLTTVTRHNVDHLLDIALHFQQIGVEVWNTTLFQSAGRGEGQEDLFEPPIPNLVRAYLSLFDAVERGLFPTMRIQCIETYLENVLSYRRKDMCQRTSCGAAADLVSISVDGAIEGCDCIANPELRLGQLQSSRSIAEALDSPTAVAIRSRHVDRLNPCAECDWRVVCGGSCLAKAGRLDGVVESECALSLSLFPAIMESLSKSDRLVEYVRRSA